MKMLCFLLLSSLHLVVSVPLTDFYSTDSFVSPASGALNNYLKAIQLTCGNPSQFRVLDGGIVEFVKNSYNNMTFKVFTVTPDTSNLKLDGPATELPDGEQERLFAPYPNAFRNYSSFTPDGFMVVTWNLEQEYGSSGSPLYRVDKFQLIFASDGTSSLVVYQYADDCLQWAKSSDNTYATMGIQVCNKEWNHPNNMQTVIADALVNGSNVNVPGMWMFLIRDSEIILPVPCRPGCDLVKGTCTEPNTCSCIPGYKGENCTTPSCPGCLNGVCVAPSDCSCDDGWLEANCDVAMCPESCVNGGCDTPNICTCDSGWDGDNCNIAICSQGCVNGACTGPDDCVCNANWQGDACDVPICLGGSDCQGSCVNPGECICDEGRTGTLCETIIMDPTPSESPTEDISSEDEALSRTEIGGIVGGIIAGLFAIVGIVTIILLTIFCC